MHTVKSDSMFLAAANRIGYSPNRGELLSVSLPGGLSNREDNRRGAPRANKGGRSTGSATIKEHTTHILDTGIGATLSVYRWNVTNGGPPCFV